MVSDPAPSDELINQYAIVTYIPDELGEFLNGLRQELVPGASGLAHVTVLPPRKLEVPDEEAKHLISVNIHGAHAFDIGLAEIQVFEKTDVIYAEIGTGREALLDLHYKLNTDALSFIEPFPYHPHVTLAQNIDHADIPFLFELASRRWEEYKKDRTFLLDRVAFVRNSEQNHWKDLAWYQLQCKQEECGAD